MPKKRLEKFITFYLGEQKYALPVEAGNQFVEFSDVLQVPQTDKNIKGLIYHNGNIVTLIDLREVLKIKKQSKSQTAMCLIFELNKYHYGLLVDGGDETIAAKKVFNDRQKKKFKRYFKGENKQKVYILEEDEILEEVNIL